MACHIAYSHCMKNNLCGDFLLFKLKALENKMGES